MSLNVNSTTETYAAYATQNNEKIDHKKKGEEASTKVTEENGAVYEKAEPEKKVTYSINQKNEQERAAIVKQMQQDLENRKSQLSDLVIQMLTKQAGTSNLADMFSPENLKNVSAADIAQAKEDISEDGYWGIKQTSQRLFDFASALAGDDVDKMKEMQAAMEKGFKQATKAWGKDLPDLCKDTLAAANKLFDEYYESKKVQTEE